MTVGIPVAMAQANNDLPFPMTTYRRGPDPELAQAAREAKSKWNTFAGVFANRSKNGTTDFAVKIPLEEKDVIENVWIKLKSLDHGQLKGILDSVPDRLHTYKLGQSISAPINQIQDWMYVHDKEKHGMFSTIVTIRRQLTGLTDSQAKLKAWTDLAAKQRKNPEIPVSLSPSQMQVVQLLTFINPIIIANAGKKPADPELAKAAGIPLSVFQSVRTILDAQLLYAIKHSQPSG